MFANFISILFVKSVMSKNIFPIIIIELPKLLKTIKRT